MTDERNELENIIAERYHAVRPEPTVLDSAIAGAILAAGYRKPEPEPEWDRSAATDDLIRMLTEYRDEPGRVAMPRFAVNMLLDKIAAKEPSDD